MSTTYRLYGTDSVAIPTILGEFRPVSANLEPIQTQFADCDDDPTKVHHMP